MNKIIEAKKKVLGTPKGHNYAHLSRQYRVNYKTLIYFIKGN